MDYDILRKKLESMPADMSTAQKVAQLNEKSLRGPRRVMKTDIERYLIVADKYFSLKASDNPIVIEIMATLNIFDSFDCTDQEVMIKYTQAINALSALEMITENDRDALLGFAYGNESWAKINLGSEITSADLYNSWILQ